MKRLYIIRRITNDEGTFADVFGVGGSGFRAVGLALPWRGNKTGISCAPEGRYYFKLRKDSPAHGIVYEEWDDPKTQEHEDIPGRVYSQLHAFNVAGDESKGYGKQADGCEAFGREIVLFKAGMKLSSALTLAKDQHGISESRTVMAEFMKWADGDEVLEVNIMWAPGISPEQEASCST